MWQIPLKDRVENDTTDTLVVNWPNTLHAILNVYKIASTEKLIRYLNATSGFLKKETWIKSIRAGNFVSWPGLTVRAVWRDFSESYENQQGHTKQMRQRVQSTPVKDIVEGKRKNSDTDADEHPEKKKIFFFKLTSPSTPFTPTKLENFHYAHVKAANTSCYCAK